jgi:hypothetical protein
MSCFDLSFYVETFHDATFEKKFLKKSGNQNKSNSHFSIQNADICDSRCEIFGGNEHDVKGSYARSQWLSKSHGTKVSRFKAQLRSKVISLKNDGNSWC